MKTGFSAWATALFALSLSACSKSSDSGPSPCRQVVVTEKTTSAATPLVFDSGAWSENNILTTLNGNERTFRMMLRQSDICTDMLADITYTVLTTAHNGTTVPLSLTGRTEWLEVHSKEASFCKKEDGNMKLSHEYRTSLAADLKPAFGTEAGNLRAILTVSFFSLGSTDLDTSYFRNKFGSLSIKIAANRK